MDWFVSFMACVGAGFGAGWLVQGGLDHLPGRMLVGRFLIRHKWALRAFLFVNYWGAAGLVGTAYRTLPKAEQEARIVQAESTFTRE